MKRMAFLLFYVFALAPYGHACIYDHRVRLVFDACAVIGFVWFLQKSIRAFRRHNAGGAV